MNKKTIRETITRDIGNVLLADNFKLNKKELDWKFEKSTTFGYNKIYILIWHYPPIYFASICLSIRVNEIEDIHNKFTDISSDYHSQTSTINIGLLDVGFEEDKIRIETQEDLEKASRFLTDITINQFRDLASKFDSPAAIDNELNQRDRRKNLFILETKRPFVGLLSAKLSGNKEIGFWKTYYHDKINLLNNDRIKLKFKELLTSLE